MIVFDNVSKNFNGHIALKNINLTFNKRETVVILGSSGGGKTTLLRCINNLETPSSGAILIDGLQLTNKNQNQLCYKIGMVFQQFYLFPHMNVLDNLIYCPCNVLKMPKAEAEEKAKNLLKQFGILEKCYSFPINLSGGQKQRVAITRALMTDPEVMLFDEPTSALDPELIKDVVEIIAQLKNQMTMIVVTHQIKFAKIIADRIIFMDQGIILADQPASLFFSKPESHRARLFLENVADLV